MTRDQMNYFIPRRADAQLPSISSTYESPTARPLNTQSQRVSSGYDYTTPPQPASQMPRNLQQPQSQYIPQLSSANATYQNANWYVCIQHAIRLGASFHAPEATDTYGWRYATSCVWKSNNACDRNITCRRDSVTVDGRRFQISGDFYVRFQTKR